MALPGSVGHEWPVPSGDSEVTAEELSKLQDCFKDPKFRDLLADYVEELKNPSNRLAYEESLRVAEANQQAPKGKVLVKPTAVFALKLKVPRDRIEVNDEKHSADDTRGEVKIFVNVCSAAEVRPARMKPTPKSARKSRSGGGCGSHSHSAGSFWEFPFVIGHQRNGLESEGLQDAQVFDVAFHPDTLGQAKGSEQVKGAIIETAMEALRSRVSTLNADDTKSFRVLRKKKCVGGTPAVMSIDEATLGQPSSETAAKKKSEVSSQLKSSKAKASKPKEPRSAKKTGPNPKSIMNEADTKDDWCCQAVKTVRKRVDKSDECGQQQWPHRVVESSDGTRMYVYLSLPVSMNMEDLRRNQSRRIQARILEPREKRRFEVSVSQSASEEPSQVCSVRLPFDTSSSNDGISLLFLRKTRELKFELTIHDQRTVVPSSVKGTISLEEPSAHSGGVPMLIQEIEDDTQDSDASAAEPTRVASIDPSLVHFRESMQNCVIKIEISNIDEDSLEIKYDGSERELLVEFSQSGGMTKYSHRWTLKSDIRFDARRESDIDISEKNLILVLPKKTQVMWQSIEKDESVDPSGLISELCDDLSILELD